MKIDPANKTGEKGRTSGSPDEPIRAAPPESEDRAGPVRARGVGASEDPPSGSPHGPPQMMAATQPPPIDEDHCRLELRIYARRVTWVLVFLGGLLFIGGLRFAGVDLDELESRGKYFRPDRSICVKTDWLETTVGEKNRAQFCVEWLDPSDTSGNTHRLILTDVVIMKDPDGKIRTHHKWKINLPLIGTFLFLAFLIVIGKRVQKNLIEKRRVRLGLAAMMKE